MPDVPEAEYDIYEPLPEVGSNQVVGLVEYLDARGGKDDIFRIAAETRKEFGEVIVIVKAAEMLDLVDTPKRSVVLSPTGHRFVKGNVSERKQIWKDQLLKHRLFREVYQTIERQPHKEVDKDLILEKIAIALPAENWDKIFLTLIRWARFGELLAYDETTEKVSLAEVGVL